jgi:hypothetical protein
MGGWPVTHEARITDAGRIELGQRAMNETNGDCPLANCGRYALYAARAYITYRKNAWETTLE